MNKKTANLLIISLLIIAGIAIGVVAHLLAIQVFGVNNLTRVVQLTSLLVMPSVLLYTFKLFGVKFSKNGLVINNLWVDFLIVVAIILFSVLLSTIVEYVGIQLLAINTEITKIISHIIANTVGVGGTLVYLLKEKEDKTHS